MRKSNYQTVLDAVIDCREAGAILGVSAERAKQFCREGRLVAKRNGRDWVISRASTIHLAGVERSPGIRPTPHKIAKRKKVRR